MIDFVFLSHQLWDTSSVMPILLSVLGITGVATAVTVAVAAEIRTNGAVHAGKMDEPLRKERRPAKPPVQAPKKPKPTPVLVERPRPTTDPVLLAARQAGKVKVRIGFPVIEDGFPDVWGVGEPLPVDIATAGPAVDAVEFTSGTSVVRERLFLRPWTGSTRFERVFQTPAELRFAATAKDANGAIAGYGERDLRIVDYRTEIVETFSDFREWVREQHPDISERITARELLERLSARYPRAPLEAWDDIALAFEEAHYSDHPIGRAHYAKMVRGFLALEEAGLVVG